MAKITAPGGLSRAITTGDGLVINYPAVASPSPIYIPLWQRESYARCTIFFGRWIGLKARDSINISRAAPSRSRRPTGKYAGYKQSVKVWPLYSQNKILFFISSRYMYVHIGKVFIS